MSRFRFQPKEAEYRRTIQPYVAKLQPMFFRASRNAGWPNDRQTRIAANPMPLPAMNPGRKPLRLLYAGTALLILILATMNAAVVLHLRESELLSQEDQLRNLSGIMAQ